MTEPERLRLVHSTVVIEDGRIARSEREDGHIDYTGPLAPETVEAVREVAL